MELNKKILIAEDELLIAKVLRMQLEKLGYQVVNVRDGDDALKVGIELQPDIIIMDMLLLNKTNGLDTAKKLRNSGVDAMIIFTTGNSYENTLLEIKDITNSFVLSKPIEFQELIKLIEY